MPRTYVDNAYNRSMGRVGMDHGTAVISSGASAPIFDFSSVFGRSSSSDRTYVDNSYNRSVGRVGLPVGSAVISRQSDGGSNSSFSGSRTYVDNAYNQWAGRVGFPVGTDVISSSDDNYDRSSKNSNKPISESFDKDFSRIKLSNDSFTDEIRKKAATTNAKLYVDNALNRRLDRVGHVIGSSNSKLNTSVLRANVYVDNKMNRSLGRVGLQIGSCPVSTKSSTMDIKRRSTSNDHNDFMRDVSKHLVNAPDDDLECYSSHNTKITEDEQTDAIDKALDYFTRAKEVRQWQEENKSEAQPKTAKRLLENFSGFIVKYEDIELRGIVGRGSFGDVHVGEYGGSIMAIKKLRVQRVSKKRLEAFSSELSVLSKLTHPNIVRLIGACIVTPNLCICMEYMNSTLYQTLHMEGVEFSEPDKISMINDISSGLEYLHGKQVAHCDIKSLNVLLDNKDGTPLVAKLSDFGLSMMKNDAETSTSKMEHVRGNLGTPRYSPPEVLLGKLLNLKDWMKADVYSLSLIMFEIACEEEPFNTLSHAQLTKHVGENNLLPEIPTQSKLTRSFKQFLMKFWQRDVSLRPTATDIVSYFKATDQIYIE